MGDVIMDVIMDVIIPNTHSRAMHRFEIDVGTQAGIQSRG
jgi:hypothetical protein